MAKTKKPQEDILPFDPESVAELNHSKTESDDSSRESDDSKPESAEVPAETLSSLQKIEQIGVVTVDLPCHKIFSGHATRIMDFRMSWRQAAAAKVLWSSLSGDGERFDGGRSNHPDGTTVENANDAMRWILDQLADAIEKESGVDLTKDFDVDFG